MPEINPTISKITLPSGNVYEIKDAYARERIEALEAYSDFLGVTTTALNDGATTNPIVVNGENVTAVSGNIASVGSKEFIFNGEIWQEFGDMSALGTLAYKNSASGDFTPAGTVSQPTFTGSEGSISFNLTPEGSVAISTGNGAANYTPAGTVSQPTFTGSDVSGSVDYTPAGTVAISTGNGDANYTPAGTVSKPTFTGTEGTVSVDGSVSGAVSISTGTGEANYTPAGTVSKPTADVQLNTTKVNSITDVGTLPSATMPTFTSTVANENLTLAWTAGTFDAGTLPTKGDDVSVATTVKSATVSQPTFTGTGVELKGAMNDVSVRSTGSFTPAGSVSQPTFSGTGAELKAAFSGTEETITTHITAAGTVSQPTFSGTGAELKAAFTGTQASKTVTYTPAGTVSQPTFTGTEDTVTVN